MFTPISLQSIFYASVAVSKQPTITRCEAKRFFHSVRTLRRPQLNNATLVESLFLTLLIVDCAKPTLFAFFMLFLPFSIKATTFCSFSCEIGLIFLYNLHKATRSIQHDTHKTLKKIWTQNKEETKKK